MPAVPESPAKRVCPLSDTQLVELIVKFIAIYNHPAGVYLYSYQRLFIRRIVESLIKQDSATMTGLFSRQSGKSESLAALGCAAAVFLPSLAKLYPDDKRLSSFARGVWIGIFAPKQQQSDIIYSRVRARANLASSIKINREPGIEVEIAASRADRVAWSNGSYIVSKTASEQSNVEGDTFHLIFIDEAQLVGQVKVEKELNPMLAATGGSMVKIGTASVHKGGFHDTIRHNLETFEKTGVRNHFEFPYDVVIREKRKAFEETGDDFHLRYERWVNVELAKMGGNIDNDTFKMNFRLLWQEAAGGALSVEVILRQGDTSLDIGTSTHGRQVGGLDLGKLNDPSILTVMHVSDVYVPDKRALVRLDDEYPAFPTKRIIGWNETYGAWEGQITDILRFLDNYNLGVLVVDATGVGDPIAERLQLLLPHIKVVPFRYGLQSNDTIFKLYLQEFEAGRIWYPASESARCSPHYRVFVHQHERLIKTYNGPYLNCSAPPGEHDDYVDSAALSNYASLMEGGDSVASVHNVLYSGPVPTGAETRADRYRSARR